MTITPPELRPPALAEHVPGWAEGHAAPDLVGDWEQRRADVTDG
ncbi:hypothetical protein [Streptomyces ipomoeae]|nr:hypothetical protein [Streptomyces ipomoeae]MDX2697145.1 hypothetical protein [Streptomyces ipomoeae]MDX2843055.1 hypothetical protein [Streptomyces ipomoeae]